MPLQSVVPQKARAGNLKLKVITLAPSLSNALIFFSVIAYIPTINNNEQTKQNINLIVALYFT